MIIEHLFILLKLLLSTIVGVFLHSYMMDKFLSKKKKDKNYKALYFVGAGMTLVISLVSGGFFVVGLLIFLVECLK